MTTHYNFCTLFDRHYATRGLALYRSLELHCRKDFRLTVLCMDVETRDFLAKLDLPKARLLLVEDLDDADLLKVRETRPRREFCWTCPAPLMLFLLKELAPAEVVTYVDADLAFFSDPQPAFDEMGDKDILIHEHRYCARMQSYAATSGIFNVGLIAIRNSPEGRTCLERWRMQCLEKCELDPDNGYCGDQKYLDEWPHLYKNLVILRHPGAALAPWNIENYEIGGVPGHVTVDGEPLIFYHYHALRVLSTGLLGLCAVVPAYGYSFTPEQRRLLYRPYAKMLRHVQADADSRAPGSLEKPSAAFRELIQGIRSRQLVLA